VEEETTGEVVDSEDEVGLVEDVGEAVLPSEKQLQNLLRKGILKSSGFMFVESLPFLPT
jgi:hypothetical protein